MARIYLYIFLPALNQLKTKELQDKKKKKLQTKRFNKSPHQKNDFKNVVITII